MRLHVVAVGRLRTGPEHALVSDYLTRAARAGRAFGFSDVSVIEVDDRKGAGKSGEAALIRGVLPKGAVVVALDERGTLLASTELAEHLAKWRDGGTRDLALVIGGADGLDPSLVAEADLALSFGPMVWPHMLARVMLSEQIYRAVSILAGSPYHRV
ncbi:23S rRNA (pseudouridine(1915)-N(3))-methyltransferase RlmH [Tropicimonas sp. IMCC34043]|uniref:23S rRNA (pseudouridine(1915)-N(3))-methyltransferase RlmH n=1 Tax=Tropicimonas sp. IMCC34043 TaxID=2248760 RepID=UPI000E2884FF|nr:23S rRNA (pseudouridine(1915)-N(3))-methyltransferase RlmH [Tropicimonas sp. IMCC34043]